MVKADGSCTAYVPCYDDDGNQMPYATRGKDGKCKLKECRPGYVLDPLTARCISATTAKGERLVLAKKAAESRRFLAAYDRAEATIDGKGKSLDYYDQFNTSQYQKRRQAMVNKRRQAIDERVEKAEKRAQWKEDQEIKNQRFFDTINREMRKGGKTDGKTGMRNSGGASMRYR